MNNFKLSTSVSTSSPTMRTIIFRIAKFVLMFVRKMMFLRRWRGSSISNYKGRGRATESPPHIYIIYFFNFIIIISLSSSITFFIIITIYFNIYFPHIPILYIFYIIFSFFIIFTIIFSLFSLSLSIIQS